MLLKCCLLHIEVTLPRHLVFNLFLFMATSPVIIFCQFTVFQDKFDFTKVRRELITSMSRAT